MENRINLQYDISVQDFNLQILDRRDDTISYLIELAGQGSDRGDLPLYSGTYTGPDMDEIANIEDISF